MSDTSAAAPGAQHGFRTVFRVVSGNFLEMYDFMVYGFYAAAIARTFFPSGNEFASLMLSLATFGAGFLFTRHLSVVPALEIPFSSGAADAGFSFRWVYGFGR